MSNCERQGETFSNSLGQEETVGDSKQLQETQREIKCSAEDKVFHEVLKPTVLIIMLKSA